MIVAIERIVAVMIVYMDRNLSAFIFHLDGAEGDAAQLKPGSGQIAGVELIQAVFRHAHLEGGGDAGGDDIRGPNGWWRCFVYHRGALQRIIVEKRASEQVLEGRAGSPHLGGRC